MLAKVLIIILMMEAELVSKIKELNSLCKFAVAEHKKGEETVAIVESLLLKNIKKYKKDTVELRKQKRKKLQATLNEYECLQTTFLNVQSKLIEIKNMEYKIKISEGPRNMRRGVLMSLLQESAKSIPLWVGKVNETPPALCGAMGICDDDYNSLVVAGDHVAALIPDLETPGVDTNENWILAEVVSYQADKHQFQVDDVDAEEGKVQYTLSTSKVALLPKWKANPVTNPEAIFSKGTLVLALYPQTTCFYRAIVDTSPTHAQDDYSLYFEDPSYSDGYAPPIRIPQRYIIICPKSDMPNDAESRRRIPGKKRS